MPRNIVILGGSSHPALVEAICNQLGIPPAAIILGKFANGETRVSVQESVRGKDVFVIQSGGGKVNDYLLELLITISACKTASARKVTAVLPLFPYSRQADLPYNKVGAPLAKAPERLSHQGAYTFDSRPTTPYPGQQQSAGVGDGGENLAKHLAKVKLDQQQQSNGNPAIASESTAGPSRLRPNGTSTPSTSEPQPDADNLASASHVARPPAFEPQRGYRQWVAQAGTLVADLLTCAGTDHVITMDLHDAQYQGFFDIPVDNLYGRHLIRKYIQYQIPNYQSAVIVSPDAGGAKRATAVADALGMPFALIHKV